MKKSTLTLAFALLASASFTASAASRGVVTTVTAVRAQANGSIRVMVADSLTGCGTTVFAATDKTHNEKIQKVALSALLAGKNVKVQYDDSTCEIDWLEIRAN